MMRPFTMENTDRIAKLSHLARKTAVPLSLGMFVPVTQISKLRFVCRNLQVGVICWNLECHFSDPLQMG